jgi:trigger factor
MSSDQTVDGLAAGLLGAKRGEPREFDVKLDGKPARCKATVHEIKRKVLPSIDDDFAKDLGVGSLGELRTELRKIIQNEHEEKSRREVALQIEKALLKTNAFPAPKSLAEHRLSDMMERIRLRLVGRERELPEKQAAEIREKLLPEAEDQVRLQFILAEIARQEKIEVTEDDVKAELERSLERTQDEEGRKGTREFFEKNADEIRAAIREAKVLKLIRDAAEVKTVKG